MFQLILDANGPPNTGTLDFVHLGGFLKFQPHAPAKEPELAVAPPQQGALEHA